MDGDGWSSGEGGGGESGRESGVDGMGILGMGGIQRID